MKILRIPFPPPPLLAAAPPPSASHTAAARTFSISRARAGAAGRRSRRDSWPHRTRRQSSICPPWTGGRASRRCDWSSLGSGLGPQSLAALRVSLLRSVDLVTGGRHCTARDWCTLPLIVTARVAAIVELQPNEWNDQNHILHRFVRLPSLVILFPFLFPLSIPLPLALTFPFPSPFLFFPFPLLSPSPCPVPLCFLFSFLFLSPSARLASLVRPSS